MRGWWPTCHRLSPASVSDFEDEVEAALRRLAKAYGGSVERVCTQAGDAGLSKRGDFVVELREGPRFHRCSQVLFQPHQAQGEPRNPRGRKN
jgi:hypothetical protein